MSSHDFDAVVVGSGFGGSAVAQRLAADGRSVCVLERGQSWPPGSFPRTPREVRAAFWDPSEGEYGLYNVWSFPGLGVLVSSGLGGGSLIYANVLLRKDEDTFVRDEHEWWPLDYDDLAPHYDLAERMLNGQRYPYEQAPYDRAGKTRAMREAGEALRLRSGFEHAGWDTPLLAVTFGNEGAQPQPGVEIREAPPSAHEGPHPRLTCVLTGECDLGCNYGSKNTLDLTYLGRAKADGAELRTSCEVRRIGASGDGYAVTFVDHAELVRDRSPRPRDRAEQAVTAKVVVVAAGTLGSTYLLLRSREAGALPRLSGPLGTKFSGNGDLLSFVLRTHEAGRKDPRVLDPSYGPVITSAIRVPKDARRRGHYVEDAGYPYLVSWLVELTTVGHLARRGIRQRVGQWFDRLLGRTVDTDLGAELAELIGEGVLSSSSMPLLSMGRDLPTGRMSLDGRMLTNDWSPEGSSGYFAELTETLGELTGALGGSWRDSRIPGISRLVTVHPLGGCPIGRDERSAVADAYGEVFGCPGLFVTDGSALPGPVGPNPSLTIAAFADRSAERILDQL
jgi:cholesterol oxidase